MKKFPFLLAISLVGNIALAALVLTTSSEPSPAAADAAGKKATSAKAANATTPKTAAADAANVDPALWSQLAGGDLASLVARLREAGFPPSLVRMIVAAQVNESFAARRKALMPPKANTPFWEADQRTDPKTMAALRELGREQSKVMKDLLGKPDREDDPAYAAMLRRQYGDLPREKVDQLSKVQQDYNDLRSEIYSSAANGSTLTPEDRAKLALLDKEQRADIQGVLSPKELEDYDLRTSNTANSMRFQLSTFSPNEEEFRTIFALQRPFDDQFRQLQLGENPTPESMRQRADAQKQLTEQIKAALGPERGAEYERDIDGNFQQINRVVQRLELPQEAAVQVWTLQKDIEQRLRALPPAPTPAARNEQLAALADEANAKLAGTLGQRGLDVYKQYGGYWLQMLQPRPVPPVRTPAMRIRATAE